MRFGKKFYIAIAIICVLAVATILVSARERDEQKKDTVFDNLGTFSTVLERVLNYYVEEVDSERLINAAIEGMLKELDEHSLYLTSYEYENLMIDTRGAFGGLGITISQGDDFPTVVSPIEDTPAYRLGIQAGDKIVQIEGISTRGWKTEEAVSKLRGPEGTQVNITVTREGIADSLRYAITREIIKVPSVTYSDVLGDIGYIRIARFAERTANEVDDVLTGMEKRGIKGLIIDLRSNPGGLLESAEEVSELFLERGKLIVYTESRIPKNNMRFVSRSTAIHDGYPIVVLVNRYSASASEILAGALQDWDKALIAGQTSFGKGSVQTVFMIGKNALKLTTARYFTPAGRCINRDRTAMEDSIEAVGGEIEDVGDGRISVGGQSEQSVPGKREEFHTAAGRTVFGGGGITPDWALELPPLTDFQRELELRGTFFSFAVHYMASHQVKDDFNPTDEVVAAFREYLPKTKAQVKDADWTSENVDYVKLAIKREFFRKMQGTKGAYRATLPKDEEINAILAMLRKAPTLKDMFAYVQQQQTASGEAPKR